MKDIHIITDNNGVGLTRSTRILKQSLADAGLAVVTHEVTDTPCWKERYEINIFLEHLVPAWFPAAKRNFLIPNQEWFPPADIPYLKAVDCVLCKTKHAQEIFAALGCQTAFISFTSEERFDGTCTKDYMTFFHLAGRSLQKGTQVIIDIWHRHPEWPTLLLIQHPETPQTITAHNIFFLSAYLDDTTLRQYQNAYSIHLCPSEAEGFGHYIVEAMSARSLVITTDGPPMNELVTPERGILVPYRSTASQRLGTNYYVDPLALEKAIENVLRMDDAKKRALAAQARTWYQENDRYFRQKIVEVMKTASTSLL